jgi:putative ABC transport system permease protein
MLQDIRYALRLLARSPGFSIIAILTLALGIGANTAIFSVVNGVLISPLPYHHPEQLVSIFQQIPNFTNASISYPNFVDWRRMNTTFSAMAAYRGVGFTLTGSGEPERLHGEMISAGFFEILGVNTILGRTFTADDDRLGAEPACLITEALWKRKFGASRDIIGQRLIINGNGRTVVGVVPTLHLSIQNFQRGTPPNEIYTPVGEYNEPRFYNARGSGWGMDAIGRLKPGVTLDQARADMDRVSHDLAVAYPDIDTDKKANLISMRDGMVGQIRPVLLFLLFAVALVLLIACVNVANLLLARSTARQQEFAIRIALGAGYKRVVRQLLTESVLLALAGGALGLLLARLGTSAAIAAVPRNMPRAEAIGLDGRVLLFTFIISVVAGIVFGLAPAWRLARSAIGGTLSESSRRVAGSRSRAQSIFVVGEMAMALVLLIAAGLMIRSLVELWHVDPGFNPQGVLTFEFNGPEGFKNQSPDAIRAAYREVHDKMASVPGVETVAYSFGAHPMGSDDESYFSIVGKPKPAHETEFPMTIEYDVDSAYFKVMQIQLKRGRLFTDADNEHAPPVIVIDESLAQKYFPDSDPLGQYLDFNTNPTDLDKIPNPQIVGVVAHVNQWGLAVDASAPLHAQVYFPFSQIPDSVIKRIGLGSEVFVRLRASAASVLPAVRSRILEFNGELVVHNVEGMEKTVADTIASERFSMMLLGVFAALALALAAIGIYGVLSYMVGQRTREIGVRMALGAQQLDVLRLVMKNGMQMTGLGLLIGLAAAFGLTRLMASLLFGVKPSDPLTFIAVALLLGVIAMLACYVPANRAMKVDPIEALRQE